MDDERIEISEKTLYNLFRAYDFMHLIDEWWDLDDELKAHYLFNLLKEIYEKKEIRDNISH